MSTGHVVRQSELGMPPAGGAGRRRGRAVAPLLVHAAWIGLLVAAVTYRVGRFGFSPTDQGFILGTSWRLLHGEIPHEDIVSARPLGSPLLHTVDFLLPGPLFLASNLVSMAQIVLMTVAFSALVVQRSLWRWGPSLVGLTAAASMINLHTHGLTAWHTVDGLMLAACGFWAIDSGLRARRPWHYRAGLALIGMAALTKQSFAFAAPIAAAVVLSHPAVRDRATGTGRAWKRRLTDLACLCVPGLVYLGVVTAAGGWPDLWAQLTGAKPAYGQRLFRAWTEAPELAVLPVLGAALLAASRLLRRRTGRPGLLGVETAILTGLVLAVLRILVDGELSRAGDWGIALFWLAVSACAVDALGRGRPPWRGMLVVLLAWMSSLSWGYDSPTFLGGTLALTALYLLGRDTAGALRAGITPPSPRRRTVAAGTVGAVAVLLAGLLLTDSHDASPYRDRPQGLLVADLGEIDPSLRDIRTNIDTFTYVEQIEACTRRHPASRVAVLPDNAFAYPAFGLRNPFPMDWPRPLELVADARERMLDTADRLSARGDYLVLFQTVDARVDLGNGASVPHSVPRNADIVDYAGLESEIRARLSGERITCGSFVGVWSPAP